MSEIFQNVHLDILENWKESTFAFLLTFHSTNGL